jgi:phosphoenolpyruvate carboxykinase (GTP)
MYGGRDAKASLPVQQSFDWNHGIIAYGASLETETTFATIGKEGIPEINLMSIQDFVAIPLGKYIKNNLEFGKKLKSRPLVFGVNYFLRDREGNFVNGVRDKHVWIKWMELRAHGEAGALVTPTGMIPEYETLAGLFKQVLGKDYPRDDYIKQFTLRVPENIAKMDRVMEYHRTKVDNSPEILFEVLKAQRTRLEEARVKHGEYISPFDFSSE